MRKPKDFISSHAAGSLLVLFFIISLVGMGVETRRQLINPTGLIKGTASAVQYIFSSIEGFISGTINSIGELNDLRKEYLSLQEQVKEYQMVKQDLDSLKLENDRLRRQLGFSIDQVYRHVPAHIIAMDPGSLFNGMTIDKGNRDGVAVDMPVIAYQDGRQGLVGKVVSAGVHTSMILPLFDQECYVAARFSESRYEGLVGGSDRKDGTLYMRYIKKRAKDEIHSGDIVVTSGLRSIYPGEIPIGEIFKIEAPEWQPSLIVEIEPVIDFSRLEYVFVLQQERK